MSSSDRPWELKHVPFQNGRVEDTEECGPICLADDDEVELDRPGVGAVDGDGYDTVRVEGGSCDGTEQLIDNNPALNQQLESIQGDQMVQTVW